MINKNTRYSLLLFGWGILVVGATVAVFSGNAAPLLTPSTLPLNGPISMFVFAGVPLLGGGVVVALLRKRAWRAAGRRAQLTPDGGLSLLGNPDLVGTRAGRTVRARTIKRKTGSSGEGGSKHTTYTVIEAEIDDPSEDGIVIGVGDTNEETDFGEVTAKVETEVVDGFPTINNAPDRTENVLTPKTQAALEEPDDIDAVYVGDTSTVILDALPDADGMIAGKLTDMLKSKVEEKLPGNTHTVTIQTKGVLLDGGELDRQVAAVATVANEFETTAPRQSS
ncbi:MAG: hypothetical protein V5A39_10665 [Haloarculaceae archaeon]